MTGRIFKWKIPIKSGKPGHIPMREAIRKAMIEQERNPKELADAVGINRFFVYNYLTGDKDAIESSKAARVLKELGLPMELLTNEPMPPRQKVGAEPSHIMLGGVVEAGAWRDQVDEDNSGLPSAEGWPSAAQRAFLVAAPDFPNLATPGDFLIALTKNPPILEGVYVILKERRHGLVQHTLHHVHITGDVVELWPLTRNIKTGLEPKTFKMGNPENVAGVVIKIHKS